MNTDLNLLLILTGFTITSAAIFTTSFLYFRKQRIAPESKKIADFAREKALKEYATYKQNTVVPFKGNPGVRVILPNESIGETQIRVLIKGKGLFGREVLLFSKNYDTVTTQIEMVSKSACDKLIKTTIAKHLLSNHIRNTGGFKTKSFVEFLDDFMGKKKKPKEALFKTFDSWPKEVQDQLIANTEAGEKSLGMPAIPVNVPKKALVGLHPYQKKHPDDFIFPRIDRKSFALTPGHPLTYDIDYFFINPVTKKETFLGKAVNQAPDIIGGSDSVIERMRNIILKNGKFNPILDKKFAPILDEYLKKQPFLVKINSNGGITNTFRFYSGRDEVKISAKFINIGETQKVVTIKYGTHFVTGDGVRIDLTTKKVTTIHPEHLETFLIILQIIIILLFGNFTYR